MSKHRSPLPKHFCHLQSAKTSVDLDISADLRPHCTDPLTVHSRSARMGSRALYPSPRGRVRRERWTMDNDRRPLTFHWATETPGHRVVIWSNNNNLPAEERVPITWLHYTKLNNASGCTFSDCAPLPPPQSLTTGNSQVSRLTRESRELADEITSFIVEIMMPTFTIQWKDT